MTFITRYISYFEYLAQHNSAIGDATGVGNRAFDVLPQEGLNEEKFRTEFSSTKPFYFAAIMPTITTIEDQIDRDGMLDILGGFLILKKHSPRAEKPNEWRTCMDDCFQIATNINRRMVRDSQNKHPLFQRSADELKRLRMNFIEKYAMGQTGNYSGFLVTFHIENFVQLLCSPMPDETAQWTDGGLTPYEL